MADREKNEDPSLKLLVQNIHPSCTDELLTLYFEKRQIFGRSLSVTEVVCDDKTNSAVVTFESHEDLQTVLRQHASHPCNFKGRDLIIDILRDDSTNTIEVCGYPKSQHTDSLKYYFENHQRSGGGLIEEISMETGDDDIIYVTFTETEAVQNVLLKAKERQHVVSGYKLSVRPIYMSKTEICISNIPVKETEETLKNFLEAKLNNSITMVSYNNTGDVAVVQFEKVIDSGKAQDKLSKHKLGDHNLTVTKVPVTNCILVTNLPGSATEDGCRFYFENKHKSGGGETQKVVYCKEGHFCLVYFKNVKDVQSCCAKRNHMLQSTELTVTPHHTCLGVPEIQDTGTFEIPESFTVDREMDRKLKFLKTVLNRRDNITKQLEAKHAVLLWKEKPIKVQCTLTDYFPDCRQIAKTWSSSCHHLLDELVCDIENEEFLFDVSIKENVKARLLEVVMPHPHDCAVFIDSDQNAVILVSFKDTFKVSCEKIRELFKGLEVEQFVKNNQKTKIQKFKSWQLEYLNHISYDKTLATKYEHLGVTFDLENGTANLQGLDTGITNAQIDLWETLENVKQYEIDVEPELITLLQNENTRQDISRTIKREGLLDLWHVKASSVAFTVTEESDVDVFKSILERAVDKLDFPLESNTLFQDTAKLDGLLELLERKFSGVIVSVKDKMKLTIHTLPRHIDEIQDEIDRYLRVNSVFEETMRLDRKKLEFLKKYMEDEFSQKLDRIKKDHYLTVDYGPNAMVNLRGTKDGLKLVKRLFKQTMLTILCEEHQMKQPGIQRFLTSNIGKETLITIEKSHSCLIYMKSTQTIKSVETFMKGVKCSEAKLPSGQKVIVYGGNMATLKVDVLVNASNVEMKHSGGLAAAIVKAGGQSIQDECSDYIKNNGTLNVGEVFIGRPGNLPCKAIAHAVGPKWNGGIKGERGFLINLVTECLKETEQGGMKSVAFPALCTGMFKYPVDKSCIDIVTSLLSYFQNNRRSSIKEVYLCDINVKTVLSFVHALKRKLGNVADHVELDQAVLEKPRELQTASDETEKKKVKTNSTFTVGSTTVELVKGDMAYEKVDIIVNSTSADLDHDKGRASKALVKVGGAAIQTESSQKYPNGINHGEVAITKAGQLKCKDILHVAIKPHKEQNSVQIMQTAINNCLTNADTLHRASIAFPAIGTGAQGFPKDIAADTLFGCFVNYFTSNPNTALRRIRVVVFKHDTDTYDAFDSKFKKYVVKYPPKSDGKQASKQSNPSHKKTIHIGSGQSRPMKGSCSLTIYATEKDIIRSVLRSIKSAVESEWYTQKIEDNAVWKLNQTQIQKIDKCASDNNVYVCVDQDVGVITIEGLVNDATGVMDVICNELRVIDRNQHEQQHAQLKAKLVRWSYSNGTKNTEFSELSSYRIELAQENKAQKVKLMNRNGQEYEVDLMSMKMHFLSNPSTQFTVIRRNMISTSFKLPNGWDPMNDGERVKLVTLPASSQEYQNAVREFTSTLGRTPNILKVERIQNPYLHAQYCLKHQEMKRKNPSIQNEKVLWHGTDVNAIQNIITNGFNRSYLSCGAYGAGVYFAVNSSYSDGGYAKPDANNHKRMLRTLVLVGHAVNGFGAMTVLPERQPGVLYDTATNSSSNPIMYIIFNDTQAYAQHIITYT